MSQLTGWLYSLRSLVRRNEADREMAEEIAFHIERQTRKHETLGLSGDAARQRALLEFGGTTRWREEARRARGSTAFDVIERDVRQALRGLRRDPAFAAMAIVTLALAIAANAAMFGIVDRVLLRGPEHVAAPEQVVRVYVTRTLPNANVTASPLQPYVLYLGARDHTSAFSAVATYTPMDVRVGSGIESRVVRVTYATPDLFSLAGVHPVVGRFYSADEDRPPRGEAVVVLGYGYWKSELAGDPSIIGKVVTLDDRQFRVVGVAPRGFTGVERAPVAAWLPMSTRSIDPRAGADWVTTWRPSTPAIVVGRLAVPRAAADAQLTAMLRREYSGSDRSMRTASVSVRPISYDLQGAEPRELGVARLLAGVAVVMLLVAAANTTNLMLARAVGRRRELSVRVALGAGRWAVVRLMVIETVTIALLGGLLGLVLAHWGGVIVREALLPNVAWEEMPVDGRALLWTAAATLVTGVIVGLIPALRVSGPDVASALRAGRTGSAGAGESHGTARASLQVVQLALSLVLLFTAGLFVRSLRDIRHLDLGYDRERVLAVTISFPRADSGTTPNTDASVTTAQARYEDLRQRFASVPGVARTSIAFSSPLSAVNISRIRVPGLDSLPGKGSFALVTGAAPGYFETVGTRILRGRGFVAADGFGTVPVVVVNETMARTLWPGADAIGRCVVVGIAQGDTCARVVGVAQDVHQMTLKEDALSQCYVPWGQDRRFVQGSVLLVRSQVDASTLTPALTAVVRRSAPGIRSLEIKTFEELLDPQVRPWRVGATLFGLFGAIVVAVAAIGLFSVVSYLVTQRTHELGVRIALGARRGQVVRLIMGGALRTAIVGAVAGGALSVLIGPVIEPLLFDNRARDPVLLSMVATGLLVVAVAASLWPAWRATRVDPLLALRAE
jgi:putative ABC transport system permease protein